MPKHIIINSSNYDAVNNRFIYRFPTPQKLVNKQVTLSGISIYNSFFNISAASYGNNTLTFYFPTTTGYLSAFTFTFPDSYMSISDMNYFIQQQCIANGLYLVNASGNNVYYFEIVANSVRYAAQMNFYPVPSTLPVGYTKPAAATWSLPTTSRTPYVVFNNAFGNLIGFTGGTYPSVGSSGTTTNTSLISPNAPNISIVNSLILTCNLVNNFGISNPVDLFYSLPLTVGFGSLITITNQSALYTDVASNDYQYVEIRLYDQNMNTVPLLDTDVLIMLCIKEKGE
jgi:hypothetical protein